MTTTAISPQSPEEVLPLWLEELQASDRARGTIRRYKSAVEGFLTWYSCEEQRPLTFSALTPIALVGYRHYVQRTQHRATSTVNGQVRALRAWCAWLTEERYLEVNPAKRLKLVGRQDASFARDSMILRLMLCCVRLRHLAIGFAIMRSSWCSYRRVYVWMSAASSL